MNEELEEFYSRLKNNVDALGKDQELKKMSIEFMLKSNIKGYTYNFSWMGRPIIAYPQDMIAMQEIIWEVKPDLIIETGIAHGGSIVYYASLLELIGENGLVVGIDIEIRKHNRELIEAHPMMKRINLIEGSSISEEVFNQVTEIASRKKKVLVCLDSNHSHEHVLNELKFYSKLVSVGSYCIVFDTSIEDMPSDYDWGNRPWSKGNNPKTAVFEFLKSNHDFIIDKEIENKLLISVAADGYLKKIK